MLLPLGNSLWPHGPSLAGLYFSIMEVTPVHCTALWEDVISLGLLQAGILQGKRELIGGALGFNLLNIHLPLSFLLTFSSSYWIRNWISLKLSSAEFMINLSIQNFIPFLVPPLFPSELRNIEEKGGLKPSRTLWAFSGTKVPLWPPFLSFFFKIVLFIYFWLFWVFVALGAFLQLWEAEATLQLQCASLSLQWLLLLQRTGSRILRLQ